MAVVVYQAALQTSSSGAGGSWFVAWDCSASPRNYNYKRYYQPGTGRYLGVDPVQRADYVYGQNNSLTWMDPLGLFEIEVRDTGGRNGPTYGGTITVRGDNGQTVTVSGSSWPNPTNSSPGIMEGTYDAIYSETGHRRRAPGVRIEDGAPIRTLGPNPGHGGRWFADGINIHCGDSLTNRGSSGCITIQPDQCQAFFGVLQEGETGIVRVLRQARLAQNSDARGQVEGRLDRLSGWRRQITQIQREMTGAVRSLEVWLIRQVFTR